MEKPQRDSVQIVSALIIAAVLPAVCVVWFMAAAMRNERLAAQERLAEAYRVQLTQAAARLEGRWKEKLAMLGGVASSLSPAEQFRSVVASGLCDAVIIQGPNGKPSYPAPILSQSAAVASAGLENAGAAETDDSIHLRARTQLAGAAARLKAGEASVALVAIAGLITDETLRHAVSAEGSLLVPNAQLWLLRLAGHDDPLFTTTLAALAARLNDYSDASLPAAQRRFLMHELAELRPDQATFPTLKAEDLAADYLDSNSPPATPERLISTGVADVWQVAAADGTRVALFRGDRLRRDAAEALANAESSGSRFLLVAPGESFSENKLLPAHPAGDFLPGWRLALAFDGDDPFATASRRQTRFYLWAGSLVVLVIALLAWLVARTVHAQMRLARMKNELVSTVSHELKTPLASMRALVDTLSAGRYHDSSQLRDYLQLIARENARLSQLIENFLAFSRLERGHAHFRREAIDPRIIVTGAISALREKLNAPGCDFTAQIDPALPFVDGDADALTTVLINLLDNAGKYSDGEPRIVARAFASDEEKVVCFEVTDKGIGLSAVDTKKIFDRFYQVDQSLTRQRGGCGLGLSIVQSIVRAHGGRVEVESVPGQGSTFRVKIPVATGDAHPSSLAVPAHSNAGAVES